jgi:serine/threonine protein kinase
LDREQLDNLIAITGHRLSESGGPASDMSDRDVADEAVRLGQLTPYQADQLCDGRTKLNLGPYIITGFIGQGGMGQVFKAQHKVMGRECAVKVLPVDKSTPIAIATFSREIRTQAKLDHPNLVHAYDAGHDGDVHYLVTEFVPGTDLRRLIRSEGPLTVQQAANIIMRAARALEYAHERGLIHRDVKPGNILVTADGDAKVSDLGLANFMNEEDEDPRAGKIVGTADYLAPEQIRNPHEINKLSDLYSLGCTLYYAITGKVPFPGGTPSSKARRHLEETPWHPRRFKPEVGEEFVEVIADMMEKDPEARIQSAAKVVARLEPWANDAGPIPDYRITKSRWAAAPFPSDRDTLDSENSAIDVEDTGQESVSQSSLGTDPAWGEVTSQLSPGRAIPPPLPTALSATSTDKVRWLRASVFAVAAALMTGIVLGFVLRGVLL